MTRLKNQRGQGSTEYILILALGVAIVLGGVYQLNSAFKVFAENYFGEYISCLLETGELPSLGGDVADGICAGEFKPFNLADGRPAVGAPVGEGGDGSSDPNKDNMNREPEPSDTKGTGGGSSANAEGSGGDAMGAGRFGGRGSRTRVRRANSSAGAGEEGEQSSSSAQSAFADGYDTNKVVRSPVRNLDGYRGRRVRADNEDDKRTKITKADIETRKREEGQQPFKVKVRVPATVVQDDGIEFSAGNLLRYLIIFIIVIAILVFIGGQALQVSKNS